MRADLPVSDENRRVWRVCFEWGRMIGGAQGILENSSSPKGNPNLEGPIGLKVFVSPEVQFCKMTYGCSRKTKGR